MGRGKERLVTCDQCGRQIRRDKAVFIEKPVFNNPLDRSEVVDEYYTRTLMREFAYCPSCGKHFRIYQKKKQMQERQREKERMTQFHGGGGSGGAKRSGPQRYRISPSSPGTQSPQAPQVPVQPAPESTVSTPSQETAGQPAEAAETSQA